MTYISRHSHLICFDPAVEEYIVALVDYLSSFSWVPFLVEETWFVWLKGYFVFRVGGLFWFPFDTLCYLLFLCWKLPFHVAPESCPTLPYLLGLHNMLSKWQHMRNPSTSWSWYRSWVVQMIKLLKLTDMQKIFGSGAMCLSPSRHFELSQ